jgi:hypothetical protein
VTRSTRRTITRMTHYSSYDMCRQSERSAAYLLAMIMIMLHVTQLTFRSETCMLIRGSRPSGRRPHCLQVDRLHAEGFTQVYGRPLLVDCRFVRVKKVKKSTLIGDKNWSLSTFRPSTFCMSPSCTQCGRSISRCRSYLKFKSPSYLLIFYLIVS